MATDNQSDVSPHLKPIHRVAGKEMAQRMSDSVAENLGQRCIARPAGLSEEFGHFHCRVAASEGRPAFQGRSRPPNPIPRRRATDEIPNPNGGRDSSVADAARIPYVGHQGTGLERPAYRQAPRRGGQRGVSAPQQISPIDKTLFSWSELRGLGRPKMSKLQSPR